MNVIGRHLLLQILLPKDNTQLSTGQNTNMPSRADVASCDWGDMAEGHMDRALPHSYTQLACGRIYIYIFVINIILKNLKWDYSNSIVSQVAIHQQWRKRSHLMYKSVICSLVSKQLNCLFFMCFQTLYFNQ